MNVQVIMQDDRPAFAVIPFAQYEQLLKRAEKAEKQADKLTFPQAVIDYKYDNDCSFIKVFITRIIISIFTFKKIFCTKI